MTKNMANMSKHGITLPEKSAARPETTNMEPSFFGGASSSSHSSSNDDTDLDSQQCEFNNFMTTQLSGKKHTPGERLQRSRERNRIHARKTRQRKKEQMQSLQQRAGELKQEQIRLKQSINEKATASILVGLFSKDASSEQMEDPRVEELLRRPIEAIPDASKLPELPALILPGQHNSKKHKPTSTEPLPGKDDLPNDGIDYDLLGKDRSKCTPTELDQIRRERNRMHAKRTRDRKRLFMEEMAEMCSKLEQENELLCNHLGGISGLNQSPAGTPELSSQTPNVTPLHMGETMSSPCMTTSKSDKLSDHGVTLDQIKTLLEAAGTFTTSRSSKSPASASTSASEGGSFSDDQEDGDSSSYSSRKRRKLDTTVPQSITATSPPTAVGV
ncbi:unnamed protein product [Cylindrotheca closterium]|uniref:BZIP domain-containing protein n=1 Tax=Cylindrotheca closterium TaxID=2856 RepID=A0AAD2CLG7_9STRA|nr:unnamed protein product [Cylindrotheca closterium]